MIFFILFRFVFAIVVVIVIVIVVVSLFPQLKALLLLHQNCKLAVTPHTESCRHIILAAVFAAKFDFKSLVLLIIDDLRYDYTSICFRM